MDFRSKRLYLALSFSGRVPPLNFLYSAQNCLRSIPFVLKLASSTFVKQVILPKVVSPLITTECQCPFKRYNCRIQFSYIQYTFERLRRVNRLHHNVQLFSKIFQHFISISFNIVSCIMLNAFGQPC